MYTYCSSHANESTMLKGEKFWAFLLLFHRPQLPLSGLSFTSTSFFLLHNFLLLLIIYDSFIGRCTSKCVGNVWQVRNHPRIESWVFATLMKARNQWRNCVTIGIGSGHQLKLLKKSYKGAMSCPPAHFLMRQSNFSNKWLWTQKWRIKIFFKKFYKFQYTPLFRVEFKTSSIFLLKVDGALT